MNILYYILYYKYSYNKLFFAPQVGIHVMRTTRIFLLKPTPPLQPLVQVGSFLWNLSLILGIHQQSGQCESIPPKYIKNIFSFCRLFKVFYKADAPTFAIQLWIGVELLRWFQYFFTLLSQFVFTFKLEIQSKSFHITKILKLHKLIFLKMHCLK